MTLVSWCHINCNGHSSTPEVSGYEPKTAGLARDRDRRDRPPLTETQIPRILSSWITTILQFVRKMSEKGRKQLTVCTDSACGHCSARSCPLKGQWGWRTRCPDSPDWAAGTRSFCVADCCGGHCTVLSPSAFLRAKLHTPALHYSQANQMTFWRNWRKRLEKQLYLDVFVKYFQITCVHICLSFNPNKRGWSLCEIMDQTWAGFH